ncbi:hypothetical protein DCS_05898 [Drechmeria coniospora]|uniref:Uncharacterized protein n=1 Tax=Drechmeria coniospora TaxID=98403 RepID=A0A151GA35_DRECN|nr:hypothetical protein DCS_05898 [Drechmeria coniospora]KYK53949.1 hypothetical protein DCS_05898 [Drechmeria coniospora]
MPLCYGAFKRPGREAWFRRYFGRVPASEQEFMLWIGERAMLGRTLATQAVRVAALIVAELA